MSKVRVGLWMMLVLALLVSGCAGGKINGRQQVTIAMGFIPNVQFAPMYVALEKGYFADEGLDIVLDYGMETDLLQRVGVNDLQFAIGSGDQVILARASELPVCYVLNWYRRFPVCIVSMADKGINEPKDLIGKTVGTPAMQGASYIGWRAFLDQVGITPDQVNLQVIGYTQVASLVEGRVDAAICYAQNEPIQLTEAGYAINVFYLDQYTHLVSNGLITNDTTIKKNPKLVQNVTRAFLRGLQDTINNPDEAFEITRKAIPEMDASTAKLQRAVLQGCVDWWRNDSLGANRPEDWQESVAYLQKLQMITTEVNPETLYSNKFIELP